MTSSPYPWKIESEPPRPRITSSPSPPYKLGRAGFLDRVRSDPSVPKSRPPLGQPGRSLVVTISPPKSAGLMVLVPSQRASSLLEACACTLEAPATRRTAHPIRKATTKAMLRPWRTTAPSPSLGMCLLLLAPPSMPHNEARRISTQAYSPNLVELEFSEVSYKQTSSGW